MNQDWLFFLPALGALGWYIFVSIVVEYWMNLQRLEQPRTLACIAFSACAPWLLFSALGGAANSYSGTPAVMAAVPLIASTALLVTLIPPFSRVFGCSIDLQGRPAMSNATPIQVPPETLDSRNREIRGSMTLDVEHLSHLAIKFKALAAATDVEADGIQRSVLGRLSDAWESARKASATLAEMCKVEQDTTICPDLANLAIDVLEFIQHSGDSINVEQLKKGPDYCRTQSRTSLHLKAADICLTQFMISLKIVRRNTEEWNALLSQVGREKSAPHIEPVP